MHAAADPCLLAACLMAHHTRLPSICMHRAPVAPPPPCPPGHDRRRSLSTGGVQSLLRSLEASASRVRQLLADRQRADAQAQGGGVYRVPSQ